MFFCFNKYFESYATAFRVEENMKTVLKLVLGLIGLLVVVAAGGLAYFNIAFPKVNPPADVQVAGTPEQIARGEYVLAAHETDDILDRLHGFGGDRLRALRAVGQDRVDINGILHEFLHLGVDRPQFCDGKIDKRGLEG